MTNLPQAIKPSMSTGREWTVAKFESSARLRGYDPQARLLALFDVLDDVTNRADREARSFVTGLAGTIFLVDLTRTITRLAGECDLRDVAVIALSLRLLLTGAATSALAGDLDSASRARAMALMLIGSQGDSLVLQEPIAEAQPLHGRDHELDNYFEWEL